jgi:hypothetical protein
MMAADEINYILRIQHMATHGGHPYLEDFYYQVLCNVVGQQQQGQQLPAAGLGVLMCGAATQRAIHNCSVASCRLLLYMLAHHVPAQPAISRPSMVPDLTMHVSSHLCALQAYLNKYYGGRNALVFAPAELRDLASEHAAHEGAEPRFADLSGLGKIVLSNIRTPKMLMDIGAGAAAADKAAGGKDGAGQQGAEGKAKPLEQVRTATQVLFDIALLGRGAVVRLHAPGIGQL